jgi:hypothetical protein
MRNSFSRVQTRTTWFVLFGAITLVIAGRQPSARIDDAQNPAAGAPPAQGRGAAITFSPTRAKFARVSQTETVENAPNWAISNLHVYEVGVAK